jgi:hypothetical protein
MGEPDEDRYDAEAFLRRRLVDEVAGPRTCNPYQKSGLSNLPSAADD